MFSQSLYITFIRGPIKVTMWERWSLWIFPRRLILTTPILIEQMFRMGIRRSIVAWICDFLHNHQKCVRFNDVLSDYVPLHGGVPQCTKLGPIGFQTLINEADENSSSKYWKYVDDLTFADNSTCAHYPSSSLQADLDDFTKWSKDNMLKLNPSKCKALQV